MKKYSLVVNNKTDGIHIMVKPNYDRLTDVIVYLITAIIIFFSTFYVFYNLDKFTTT